MEVAYNLRYQKFNFSNKPIIDKEGEAIVYAKGFRLKGKGAGDKGELINFSEIKEFYHRDGKINFITFAKEKYVLSEAGTLFDELLRDMYKSRNEFLMDALFMKNGKVRAEFEGHFDRVSKFNKPINKGNAKIRLHEGSLVIIPDLQDAFAIDFNFVNFHEFNDMEYTVKIVADDGNQLFLSQLGNDFEIFQEKLNNLLGGMYQTVVNGVLKEIFPEYNAGTLLKLAYKMKGGKAVMRKDLDKIDKELAEGVDQYVFEDEKFRQKSEVLRELTDEYHLYYGIAADQAVSGSFVRWAMFVVPESNVVGFSILPRWQDGTTESAPDETHDIFFYKIIMEKGSPAEKAEDKVQEVNHALVHLGFAKDPCYKNKRDLRHSPYQYAIRKLPYLRILRKSFVAKVSAADVKEWQQKVKKVLKDSKLK